MQEIDSGLITVGKFGNIRTIVSGKQDSYSVSAGLFMFDNESNYTGARVEIRKHSIKTLAEAKKLASRYQHALEKMAPAL